MKTTENILVVDLEATCWDGPAPLGEENEIIEIGICILHRPTGSVSRRNGLLIRPEQSSVSPFCTQLTTITPELLDAKGMSFAEACRIVQSEYNGNDYTWASYGAYDLNMMRSQCQARRVDFPLSQQHINVKDLFSECRNTRKKVGMSTALSILGLPLEGTHHRGVDDAVNIAKILDWCLPEE